MVAYLMSFIDNWSHDCEILKGHWCQEHKWKLILSFVIFMTSLDHSFVHVLDKQEFKYLMCKCKDT
jgi:hypothetical protein